MSQKRMISIIGIIFAIIGLISITLCLLEQGKSQILLPLGLMSNSIALFLYSIANKKKPNA